VVLSLDMVPSWVDGADHAVTGGHESIVSCVTGAQ